MAVLKGYAAVSKIYNILLGMDGQSMKRDIRMIYDLFILFFNKLVEKSTYT